MSSPQPVKNYIVDETMSPYKIILILAWPVLLEQMLSTMIMYVNTAMVGSLGAYATAAASISNPVFMMVNGIVISMGVGVTALLARSVGAGDAERAKSLIRHAVMLIIYAGVPVGVLIGIFSHHIPLWMGARVDVLYHATRYNVAIAFGRPFAIGLMIAGAAFRGRGDTRTPMIVNIGMNVMNILMNFLLIHPSREITVYGAVFNMPGVGLGVLGAGVSTTVSQICACSTLVFLLYKKQSPYRISLKENYKIDMALVRPIFSISWPAMLERLSMSGSGIIVTSSIASLGTASLAANTLYLAAESMSFMPGFAFMTSITTMVGQCLGAKKENLAKRYTYLTVLYATALLSLIAVFLYVFAENILSFFTPDKEVIALAVVCLRIVAFLQPIQVTAWVFAGALRGAGDTKYTLFATAVCSWSIRALGSFVCIRFFGLGLQHAVMCMFADATVRMILLFTHFRSGKWRKAIKV